MHKTVEILSLKKYWTLGVGRESGKATVCEPMNHQENHGQLKTRTCIPVPGSLRANLRGRRIEEEGRNALEMQNISPWFSGTVSERTRRELASGFPTRQPRARSIILSQGSPQSTSHSDTMTTDGGSKPQPTLLSLLKITHYLPLAASKSFLSLERSARDFRISLGIEHLPCPDSS
jgi:hypothetical protein